MGWAGTTPSSRPSTSSTTMSVANSGLYYRLDSSGKVERLTTDEEVDAR